MPIAFQIDQELENQLRRELPNLDRAAKEAFLVSLYREGRLSHAGLATELRIGRFEVDAVLKQHHVTEDLPGPEDLEADLRTLDRVLGPLP